MAKLSSTNDPYASKPSPDLSGLGRHNYVLALTTNLKFDNTLSFFTCHEIDMRSEI
jgi:hypothetical protein